MEKNLGNAVANYLRHRNYFPCVDSISTSEVRVQCLRLCHTRKKAAYDDYN